MQSKKQLTHIYIIMTVFWCSLCHSKELQVLNPYNAKTNIESENFSYWYDDADNGVDIALLRHQLDTLEAVYHKLVVQSGFKNPITEFKINIYMSNAGGSYDRGEAQAHVDVDSDGHSFMHMSKEDAELAFSYQYTSALIAHEFFHIIQGQYDNSLFDAWFMEGWASWISFYVDDDTASLWSAEALAKTPELTLTFSDYEELDDNKYWHMYATSYFFHWLSEATSPNFIKELLSHAEQSATLDSEASSLKSLISFTQENYGQDLKNLYSEFTSRNILWDYPFKQNILRRFKNKNFQVGDNVTSKYDSLSKIWHEIKQQEQYGAPQGWGASYIEFDTQNIDSFDLSFWGEKKSSDNSDALWHLTLVKVSGEDISYQKVNLTDDNHLNAFSIDSNNLDTVYLSVNAYSEISAEDDNEISSNEVFNYAFQIAEKGTSTRYKKSVLPIQPSKNLSKKSNGGAVYYGWLLLFSLFINYRKTKVLNT